jgi:prepilin-type N-terminal cleavage/methylation domain-containing protein
MRGSLLRPGLSLLELIAVLAVLATATSMAALAFSRQQPPTLADDLASARRLAATSGQSTTRPVVVEGDTCVITALPDGRLLGGERLGLDEMTGTPDPAGERHGGWSRRCSPLPVENK